MEDPALYSDETITKLYRIRKTVYKMLSKRGYLIDTSKLNQELADFKIDCNNLTQVTLREGLTVNVQVSDRITQFDVLLDIE